MHPLRPVLILLLVSLAAAGRAVTGSETSKTKPENIYNFLLVKYGDEFATAERAAEFLSKLEHYLANRVSFFAHGNVRGWIANRPAQAVRLLEEHPPVLAFVPPGFWLQHLLSAQKASAPVARIPRFGSDSQKYYLVAKQGGISSLKELQGGKVATTFGVDWEYLKKVVFPPHFQPQREFQLEPVENLADEMFLILEESGEADMEPEKPLADALLLDEDLKLFFQEDEWVWPKLQILWTSETLIRDLVVTVGEEWNSSRTEELRKALFGMGADDVGRELLHLMQSSGFSEVDWELMEIAMKKYGGGW